jgi:hypothetical protein
MIQGPGVIYKDKSFNTSTLVANLIKLFQHNLHHFWRVASSSDSGYGARGVNYTEKKFYKIDAWSLLL